MKATLLYRIAAVIFVLMALGHTFGFLRFKPPTPAGIEVRDAMERVQFQADGQTFSYGGFYRGFGLSITAYLLFFAVLAWQLGTLSAARTAGIATIAWSLVVMQVSALALCFLYFPIAPTILSALLTICLAWAAWIVGR
jgi:hypothetical protein